MSEFQFTPESLMCLSELVAKAESRLARATNEGWVGPHPGELSPIDLLECALDFWTEEMKKQVASEKERVFLLTRSLREKSRSREAKEREAYTHN